MYLTRLIAFLMCNNKIVLMRQSHVLCHGKQQMRLDLLILEILLSKELKIEILNIIIFILVIYLILITLNPTCLIQYIYKNKKMVFVFY